ncbi:MAG: hypothetical protein EOP04_09100, partial [Proteobacteria bacterium]
MFKNFVFASGVVFYAAHAYGVTCEASAILPITCSDLNAKWNQKYSLTESKCYKVQDSHCEIKIAPALDKRSHSYAYIEFNSLSFAPSSDTWLGSLRIDKMVGQTLSFANFKISESLWIDSGRIDKLDTSHSLANPLFVHSLVKVPKADFDIYNTRKYFGQADLSNMDLSQSLLQVSDTPDVRLVEVNLESSQLQGIGDLSNMSVQRVNFNNFKISASGFK